MLYEGFLVAIEMFFGGNTKMTKRVETIKNLLPTEHILDAFGGGRVVRSH